MVFTKESGEEKREREERRRRERKGGGRGENDGVRKGESEIRGNERGGKGKVKSFFINELTCNCNCPCFVFTTSVIFFLTLVNMVV